MTESNETPQESTANPRRHSRRRRKVLFIVLAILILSPVIAWFIFDQVGRWEFRREIARIEARGEHVQWKDFIPPPVPDAENAALIYEKGFALLKEGRGDTASVLLEALQDEGPWEDRLMRARQSYASVPEIEATEADAWQAARQHIARIQPGLVLIRQANAMSKCRFDLPYDTAPELLFSNVGRFRSCARKFTLEAMIRAKDGDVSGAYEDNVQILRLARGAREPFLVTYLVENLMVRVGIQGVESVLGADSAHADDWRRVLAQFDALDLPRDFASAINSERAIGPYLADWEIDQEIPPIEEDLILRVPKFPLFRTPKFLLHSLAWYKKATYLRWASQAVDAARLPAWEARKAIRRWDRDLAHAAGWRTALISQGTFVRVFDANARIQSHLALARVALALKLYKHAHGQYPAALDALAPDILKAVPSDPCTGTPLVYRRTGEGFIVYSVGLDDVDNNGNTVPPDKTHSDEGVDIVWKAEK